MDTFNYSKYNYINFGFKSAHLSYQLSKRGFAKEELVEHISFIVDHSYIIFNNHVYRQIIGIPMGTSCAPHLANIFLHMYEKAYINNIIGTNLLDSSHILTELQNIFRYQDDLIVFEDNGVFQNIITDIYPPEMLLKNTNVSSNEVNYLDLNISVHENKYIYKSYDKRKDFKFIVINYPNLSGNIPMKQAYGTFTSQLIRFSRINLNINDFKRDIINMVNKLVRQHYHVHKLLEYFIHFANFYPLAWTCYGHDILDKQFIDDIFF